jgi:hypothetical protein
LLFDPLFDPLSADKARNGAAREPDERIPSGWAVRWDHVPAAIRACFERLVERARTASQVLSTAALGQQRGPQPRPLKDLRVQVPQGTATSRPDLAAITCRVAGQLEAGWTMPMVGRHSKRDLDTR